MSPAGGGRGWAGEFSTLYPDAQGAAFVSRKRAGLPNLLSLWAGPWDRAGSSSALDPAQARKILQGAVGGAVDGNNTGGSGGLAPLGAPAPGNLLRGHAPAPAPATGFPPAPSPAKVPMQGAPAKGSWTLSLLSSALWGDTGGPHHRARMLLQERPVCRGWPLPRG